MSVAVQISRQFGPSQGIARSRILAIAFNLRRQASLTGVTVQRHSIVVFFQIYPLSVAQTQFEYD